MNRLHAYSGDGKGKTTAAMGLALRCPGHGSRVLVGQFMEDGRSGERIERIAQHRPRTIVLDELGVALASGETVVTGRVMPGRLPERADYISRIEAQRHPYETEGLPARKGVEW